jgi:hypothetical protein
MQAGLGQFLVAADRIGEMRVAAVDQDVALVQQGLSEAIVSSVPAGRP